MAVLETLVAGRRNSLIHILAQRMEDGHADRGTSPVGHLIGLCICVDGVPYLAIVCVLSIRFVITGLWGFKFCFEDWDHKSSASPVLVGSSKIDLDVGKFLTLVDANLAISGK